MNNVRRSAGFLAAIACAIAALVAVSGPAAHAQASHSAPAPRLLGCNGKSIRPAAYNPICNDGSGTVISIRWSRWSGSADGKGKFYTHICNPNCATGPVILYSVEVSAWRVRNGAYTRFSYRFLSGVPKGFPRSWTIAYYSGRWHGLVV